MSAQEAKFQVGQIVHHKLFDYIGVIFDVDPSFQGTDDWYRRVARSHPLRASPGITCWSIMRFTSPMLPSKICSLRKRRSGSCTRLLSSYSASSTEHGTHFVSGRISDSKGALSLPLGVESQAAPTIRHSGCFSHSPAFSAQRLWDRNKVCAPSATRRA